MASDAPFPGLRALRPDEAHRLHGRGALVASLAARVRAGASLVLVGPPGVGRSSLLAAGLLPALRDAPGGALDVPAYRATAARRMCPLHLAPGAPFERPDDPLDAGAALVVLVDDADALDDATVTRLQALAREPEVRFVFALADPSRLPALSREVAVVEVDPLPSDALAAALDDAGAALVPGLADAMAAELGDDPAALAWLQFAAQRLWATRERPDAPLTHTALRALGGIRGCLTRHVEATLAARPRAEQELAPALVAALVTPAGTAPLMPRAAVLARLPARQRPNAAALLDALVAAGLAAAAGERVGLAHAVVAAAWPSPDAPRPASRAVLRPLPVRHGPVVMALAGGLGALSFVATTSLVQASEAASAVRAEAQGEVARARQELARQGVEAAAAAAAIAAAQADTDQTHERLAERRIEAMAERARSLGESDPSAGLMVALASYDLLRAEGYPDAAAATVLRRWEGIAPTLRLIGHTGHVVAAEFSPDGALLATAAMDGSARLWSVASGRTVARIALGTRPFAVNLAFSDDSARLAVAAHDGRVVVARSRDGAIVTTARPCAGRASQVAWTRDGDRLLVGCEPGDVGAIDPVTGARVWWRAAGGALRGAGFDTDGVRVLWMPSPACCDRGDDPWWAGRQACESGTTFTLDAATGATRSETPTDVCHNLPVALDPDGEGLLLGDDHGLMAGLATPRDRDVSCQRLHARRDGRVDAVCLDSFQVFDAAGGVSVPLPLRENIAFVSEASEAGIVAFRQDNGHAVSVRDPGAAEPRIRMFVPSYSSPFAPRAFSPSGDALLADYIRQPTLDLWAARPPPRGDFAAIRTWALARSNLRVCQTSLAVVVVDSPPPDSPWAPPTACAGVSR